MSRESRISEGMGSYQRKLAYRKLLEDVEQLEERCGNSVECIEKTGGVVEEAARLGATGALTERAEHPGEGLLDSRLLLASSYHVARLADTLSGNINQYDPDELAHHIKTSPEYWSSIEFPGSIGSIMYLYGTFLPGPPAERPQRQRRAQVPSARHQTRQPEDVSIQESNPEEASAALRSIKKFIVSHTKRTQRPLSYFPLVLHPTSFSTTIENIYHLSFLVRDGIVAITIDEENQLPYVSLVSKEARDRTTSDEQAENNQFVVSLDMAQWREAVEAFNIQEPMLNIR